MKKDYNQVMAKNFQIFEKDTAKIILGDAIETFSTVPDIMLQSKIEFNFDDLESE